MTSIMQVELVTKQDLEAFKQELLKALANFMRGKSAEEKEWLRSKEVRKILNISSGSLASLRVKKLLNPTKVSGVYYYRLSEIKALLSAGAE